MAIDIVKATHRLTGAVLFAPYYEHDLRAPGCRAMAHVKTVCLAAYGVGGSCPQKTKAYIHEHKLKADPLDWEARVVETGLDKQSYKRKLVELQLIELIGDQFVLEYSFKGV